MDGFRFGSKPALGLGTVEARLGSVGLTLPGIVELEGIPGIVPLVVPGIVPGIVPGKELLLFPGKVLP